MKKHLRILPALALLCAAAPALAHHADIMFAPNKTVSLSGTVKSFEYANPHSTIALMVPEKGAQPMQWTIETDSPIVLQKVGIQSDTLHPGDKIAVRIHPLKDGTAGGSLIELKRDDGMLYVVQKAGAFGVRAPVVGAGKSAKKPAS
jgi:hypothetical protein